MNKTFWILYYEFKKNIRLLLIWSILWLLMAFAVIATFDGLAANSAELEVLYKSFPPELLQAFSIDPTKPNDFPSFFNSQFFVLYLIASAILIVFLAVSKIGKEITNKNLTFLLIKPVTRGKIFLAKYFAVIAQMTISNFILLTASTLLFKVGIKSISEVPVQYFVNLFFLSIVFQLFFIGVAFLLSSLLSEGKALGIGIGISVIGFFMNFLTAIKGVPEFLKYFNPFYYLDLLQVSNEGFIALERNLPLIILGIILSAVAFFVFKRKDVEV